MFKTICYFRSQPSRSYAVSSAPNRMTWKCEGPRMWQKSWLDFPQLTLHNQ
ncbi:MAG: hypothetical protein JWN73_2673 [Betaproteobacteria bacterium]|nr:hypothetical protein [Betaproteobacteria bacterium]